ADFDEVVSDPAWRILDMEHIASLTTSMSQ
ncbi:MAG: hypothetical protein EZS28_019546, partial [Streblomastix strix]